MCARMCARVGASVRIRLDFFSLIKSATVECLQPSVDTVIFRTLSNRDFFPFFFSSRLELIYRYILHLFDNLCINKRTRKEMFGEGEILVRNLSFLDISGVEKFGVSVGSLSRGYESFTFSTINPLK